MFISKIHDNSGHIGPGYYKPTKGVLSCLPSSCVPYAELMRLYKPVGTLNIYFPYLFGSLFAACAQHPFVTSLSVLSANLKLFAMAFLLRSAGCTWNDLIDRDLDRKVARCRLRPIARYAVSPRSGFIFYAIQFLVWLAMLLQTDARTVYYALGCVFLGHLYPFAKRSTDYPQSCLASPFPGVYSLDAYVPLYEAISESQDMCMNVLLSRFFHPLTCGARTMILTWTMSRHFKASHPRLQQPSSPQLRLNWLAYSYPTFPGQLLTILSMAFKIFRMMRKLALNPYANATNVMSLPSFVAWL